MLGLLRGSEQGGKVIPTSTLHGSPNRPPLIPADNASFAGSLTLIGCAGAIPGWAPVAPITTAAGTDPSNDMTTIIAAGNLCAPHGVFSLVIPWQVAPNYSHYFNTFHDFSRVDAGGYYGDRYYGRSNYYDYNYRGNGYDNLSPYYNEQYRDFGYNNYYRCKSIGVIAGGRLLLGNNQTIRLFPAMDQNRYGGYDARYYRPYDETYRYGYNPSAYSSSYY